MAVFATWTTTQLTNLGLWLAKALGLGVDAAPVAAGDTWTTERLTNFGMEMSKGFGTGL